MADGDQQTGDSQLAKQRLRQVFQFLKELNQYRYPPKREIKDQKWSLSLSNLPQHPAIQLGRRTAAVALNTEDTDAVRSIGGNDANEPHNNTDFVLRVRRANLTKCPQPPNAIQEWILTGWESPSATEAVVQASRNEVDRDGETIIVHFDDDPTRIATLSTWRNLRNEWRENELPARAAFEIYEQISTLRGTLQRESEKCDLVLGDGVLSWNDPAGSVFHPVLLQRVQLEFDPKKPEFTIIDADSDSELYLPLLNSLTDVDPKNIAPSRMDLTTQALHPLMDEASPFLKELATRMFTKGELVRHQAPPRNSEIPLIGRSPYLFLRDRVQGFSAAIDKVLETIESRTDICSGLFKIVGVDQPNVPIESTDPATGQRNRNLPAAHQDDILFGKFANQQQFEIATRLSSSHALLVQGPPGTGKSHTIANLIGHLLAQNRSVLVTSHTTKALRVLRGHLAAELRPLCVSLLDQDAESREQLKESVQGIPQRLSTDNEGILNKEAWRFGDERQRLLQKLKTLKQQMLDARSAEYRDVVLAGEIWTPSDAARLVHLGNDQHNWIPGPLGPGVPMPLSVDEVYELYRTNTETNLLDTTHIHSRLPVLATLITADKFEEAVRFAADGDASRFKNTYWSISEFTSGTVQKLGLMQQDASNAVTEFRRLEKWQVAAVEAGRRGDGMAAAWEKLFAQIEESRRVASESSILLTEHSVQLNGDDSEVQQPIALEIAARYRSGKRRIPWGAIGKRWKLAIDAWKVSDRAPSATEHFEAIAAAAGLKWQRQQLAGRWKTLFAEHGGPDIDSFGSELEQTCSQYLGRIRSSLAWWETKVTSLHRRLQELGFHWAEFLDSQPPLPGVFAEMQRTLQAIGEPLQSELTAVVSYMKSLIGTARLSKLTATLCEYDHPEVVALKNACNERDVIAYERALETLASSIRRRQIARRRMELLGKLEAKSESGHPVAPQWAVQVGNRIDQHANAEPPGNPVQAWKWRQLHEELERRAVVDVVALARETEAVNADLLRVTNNLIDRRVWAGQHSRVALKQRQALNGWLYTINRLGGGNVIRAAQLRAQARDQLRDARTAVPVWVMPLTRVMESFDFDSATFDVVIVDEASQCDGTALVALMLGKSVIIVGDEEQVTPSAFGQTQEPVKKLIDTFLVGIPNAANYDGKQSIYQLALTAFKDTTCLLEHFRCVPDIIRFSNSLSYDNRMKPLREQGSSPVTPAVVPFRVANGIRDGYVNRIEGLTIASFIAAAIEFDDYAGQTFGVICMVGSEQAVEIESRLRQHISPSILEERRVICGNAAQFQGDERDVMFLSVVDSPKPDGGPQWLNARQDAKQRFNVAASRARNQMWVVYSLNPDTDLKPGDLRRMLIEHARDPNAIDAQVAVAQVRAQSPFEKKVIENLVRQRYRVTPQWRVGAYSIDIVVEGGGKRLAVECDGDRFHPIAQISDDMARQEILERLGWTFHRIRGSEFFRDVDATMQRLFNRLQEMGIPPELEIASVGNKADSEASAKETSADRVIRRAAELRAEWLATEQSKNPNVLGNSEGPGERIDAVEVSETRFHPVDAPEIPSASTVQIDNTQPREPPFEERIEDEPSPSANDAINRTDAAPNGGRSRLTHAKAEFDVGQFIPDVLRISSQPLKAKEIRSRICQSPFRAEVDTSTVNSLLYGRLSEERRVYRVEGEGTVRWKLSTES